MLRNESAYFVTDSEGRKLPEEFFELKTKIHDRLLDAFDISKIDTVDRNYLRSQIIRIVQKILSESERVPLNEQEKERLIQEIPDEVLGYGPIEPFLQDETVSDILVNTYKDIYVERHGRIEETDARFKDNEHLMKIIDRIASSVGRHIDESSPMVDARLPDGSRVNAIIPPLAIDGPMLSIRRFAVVPLEMDDLVSYSTLPSILAQVLEGIVKARLNVLISGGTGSGKTTFLNVLSRYIPSYERTVTIEDSAELQLKQKHVVRLETRPPNIEGKGQITQRDLVINSLRMRPDRIIVGEVRGMEAFDMLQAMNTGHEGSLTTIHANSPRDALMRLESMVSMANMDIPTEFMRRYISSALDVIIHIARLSDGTRKLISLQEITGMEGNIITLQELFSFKQKGIGPEGEVKGRFSFHGIRPQFWDKFRTHGLPMPEQFLDPLDSYEI